MRQALLDNTNGHQPGPTGPGFTTSVTSLEEAHQHIESLTVRVGELERLVRDHAQRWDTHQTPFWKRIWFLIDGWPWRDLNGVQKHRPWHRGR